MACIAAKDQQGARKQDDGCHRQECHQGERNRSQDVVPERSARDVDATEAGVLAHDQQPVPCDGDANAGQQENDVVEAYENDQLDGACQLWSEAGFHVRRHLSHPRPLRPARRARQDGSRDQPEPGRPQGVDEIAEIG
ncbi:hypothetical protein [Bradyrhizobium sp. 930_D9_N1_4]|uniref:hypothetical protein n=1 Tax=Bradyrhizobium sp. 930_D9_N1_4 TaxID=3240374 RepID=UPI003F8CC9F8